MEIDYLDMKSKIEQDKDKFVFEWAIELQSGQIELKFYSFDQTVRKKTIHVQRKIKF